MKNWKNWMLGSSKQSHKVDLDKVVKYIEVQLLALCFQSRIDWRNFVMCNRFYNKEIQKKNQKMKNQMKMNQKMKSRMKKNQMKKNQKMKSRMMKNQKMKFDTYQRHRYSYWHRHNQLHLSLLHSKCFDQKDKCMFDHLDKLEYQMNRE